MSSRRGVALVLRGARVDPSGRLDSVARSRDSQESSAAAAVGAEGETPLREILRHLDRVARRPPVRGGPAFEEHL